MSGAVYYVPMLGRIWNYVSNNPLIARLLGALLATWLLAWRWSDVKLYLLAAWAAFADTADYLAGTVQVRRGTLLALLVGLLVFAVALAHAAVWLCRGLAENAPAAPGLRTPVSEPTFPGDFKPTEPQGAALVCAFQHHPNSVDLRDVTMKMRTATSFHYAMPAHAERALEELCQLGWMQLTDRFSHRYRLTPAGLKLCHEWDDRMRHQSVPRLP